MCWKRLPRYCCRSPIAEVKKDDELKFNFTFADSNDYDVWISDGPFPANVDPTAATTVLPISVIKTANGSDVSSGSTAKSFKYNNTMTGIKVKVPNDGVLFIKWSKYGNGAAGGGTFKPKADATITSE